MVVQEPIQEHGVHIEDQVNDPMEEGDDANNTVEEDGINILIQETFNNVGMDDDDEKIDGGNKNSLNNLRHKKSILVNVNNIDRTYCIQISQMIK